MRPTTRHFRAAAIAALVLTGAACSSSPSTNTGPGAGSTGGTTTSAPPASTEPASGAGATAAIKTAYNTLFDLANPALAPKVAVIQDGAGLQASLQSALKSSLAKSAGGAQVISATPQPTSGCSSENLPTPCDGVSFNILSTKGKSLLADNGFAIYQDGKWLVAKVTICGLLSLAAGGKAPAGC